MAGFKQFVVLSIILILLCQKTFATEAESEAKEELVESESKDGKLEIIKRIKKVNDDGSYTIGYEADDGSFKIESRDVLGNIKVISKPEPPSVVQRIPNKNRTTIATTKRPSIVYPTSQSTSTSSSIQSIARRRNVIPSSTTLRPNYSEVVNVGSTKTTSKPSHVIYSSAAPRVLLQGRNSAETTIAPHIPTQKSEGQLIRPEIVSPRPSELPLFRRLALNHPLVGENSKPVVEESQVRSNILRRELSQERNPEYDLQEHVFSLQQSLGDDATDVYSGSVTTGTPRPLFTTTLRPRGALLSTTQAPLLISRPTIRYPNNYQQNILQDVETSTSEYSQESSTTTESAVKNTTPTPVPVVQIPANRQTQEPLVAIRHPYQRGAILVPLSQLRGQILPIDNIRDINNVQQEYATQQEQYIRDTTQKPLQEVQQRPIILRRVPPPPLRPIPVQVDENGYIRELSHQVPTPYPIPVPITPVPKYINNDVHNEIDNIEPPVSTRDFQKLLQQLILRQSRLERVSALTNNRYQQDYPEPRVRPIYRPTPIPYFVHKIPAESRQNGPVQFITDPDVQHQRQRQYVDVGHQQQHQLALRHRQHQQHDQNLYANSDQYANAQSYIPTRRVARLLPSMAQEQSVSNNDEYLPPDVREMLLLRMLQLAINPALPVENDEPEQAEPTTSVPQYKRAPVRNVEILGEEQDSQGKKGMRSKRYRELDMDYYE